MKRSLVIFLLLFGFIHHSFAQTDKALQKKLDKANDLVEKNKTADAEKLLLQVTKDYPSSGDAWDMLSLLEYDMYLQKKESNTGNNSLFSGNFTITTTDSSGKAVKDDTLAQKLTALLNGMTPAKIAFDKFIDKCKEACLHTNDAYRSSVLIRKYMVDSTFDTAVNPAAVKYFDKAETEFRNKNYNSALDDYHQALEIDSNYYECRLYLGDAYFFLNDYKNAIKYYSWARTLHRSTLEPLKYIADAYAKQKDYAKAAKTSVDAILVYPDDEMFLRWANNLYEQGMPYTLGFIPRDVTVDVVGQDNEMAAPKNSSWQYYQDALKLAEPYCNKDGIFIKDNNLTKSKYLEVYAWEYMLSRTNDPHFDVAKKIQQKGFLEPFVLVGNFQYDFYRQYKDYVAANSKAVRDYFDYMSQVIK